MAANESRKGEIRLTQAYIGAKERPHTARTEATNSVEADLSALAYLGLSVSTDQVRLPLSPDQPFGPGQV